MLDEYGMPYIEGGWPGSNPKDVEGCAAAKSSGGEREKRAAFGSSRHRAKRTEEERKRGERVAAGNDGGTSRGERGRTPGKEGRGVTAEQNRERVRRAEGAGGESGHGVGCGDEACGAPGR